LTFELNLQTKIPEVYSCSEIDFIRLIGYTIQCS